MFDTVSSSDVLYQQAAINCSGTRTAEAADCSDAPSGIVLHASAARGDCLVHIELLKARRVTEMVARRGP